MTTAPRTETPRSSASTAPRPAPPRPRHEELHLPDDRFVPVRQEDLIDALHGSAGAAAPDPGLREVARAIGSVIAQEAEAFRAALDRRYAAFNPDRDTVPQCDLEALRSPDEYDTLRRQLHYLITKANFEQLDDVQVDAAVRLANSQGLQIRLRPQRVRHLDLYVRGRATVERKERLWWAPWRSRCRHLTVFQRMVVVARLTDNPYVVIKLFREIPAVDVEALLPHAEVLMSRLDRLVIIGGGAGALGGVATKVFWFFVGGAVVASQLLWPVILALGTLSVKSFLGYRRARHFRDSQRTRHLYERNLAANATVLHTLTGLIGQEETKEAVLAYAVLAAEAEPPADAADLGRRVERWLRGRFGVDVDFDVLDAIESLDRLDLWRDRAAWKVAEPAEAIARLRSHWQARRTAEYHLRGADACGGK